MNKNKKMIRKKEKEKYSKENKKKKVKVGTFNNLKLRSQQLTISNIMQQHHNNKYEFKTNNLNFEIFLQNSFVDKIKNITLQLTESWEFGETQKTLLKFNIIYI